jgi:hypothetical protein
MFDVSLQLLCTSKSGTLSRVIREINLLGLQYKHHQIEYPGELFTRLAVELNDQDERDYFLSIIERDK